MRLTPRVAGFRLEYPAGFELECMAGFVGTRTLTQIAAYLLHSTGELLKFRLIQCHILVVPTRDKGQHHVRFR